jgi:hypothetical protein
MRTLAVLTAVMLLTAAVAVSAIQSLAPAERATASLQPVTISIQELHRQVNMRSLPEPAIASLY